MDNASKPSLLPHPYSWEQLAYGLWAKTYIQTRLNEWLPKFFGYHMLKLGGLSCELESQTSLIPHQVLLDKDSPSRNLEAENITLPFMAKAFDLCILANQLDYTDEPHRLLREIDRVTVDDGHLFITGINPISFLGLSRVKPWQKNKQAGKLLSPTRIQDWLRLLNYEVLETSCMGLIPNKQHRWYWSSLESYCAKLLPVLGSLYFIVAKKRTYPLLPISPMWKLKKPLSPVGGLTCCRTKHRLKP